MGFSNCFLKYIDATHTVDKSEYKVLLIGESGRVEYNISKADTIICPSKITVSSPIKCTRIISCGMNPACTLSFSCIGKEKALLSLNRTLNGIPPGEVYVKLKKDLSVYDNLVYQALRLLQLR